MKKTGNFFNKKKANIFKPPPPPSLRQIPPPPVKNQPKKEEPKKIVRPPKKNIDLSYMIPRNFARSKYSKEDIQGLFRNILDLETIDEVTESFENFINDDVETSYNSEMFNFILQEFSLPEIKFIAFLFLKTEIASLSIFFDKFLRNREELDNMRKITKFIKSVSFRDDDNDFIEKIQNFTDKNPLFQSIFKDILNNLNKQMIKSLFDGFLNQGTFPFFEYYSKVFVRENKALLQQQDLEKNRLKTEKETLFEDKTLVIEKNKKIALEKAKFISCVNFFKKIPWITDDIVVRVLVSRPINMTENCSSLFDDYIIPESKSYINDCEWFEVNEKYFEVQCNESYVKHQNRENLIISGGNGQLVIIFRIGFTTIKNEFIIQNESIFRNERTFFANSNQNLNEITVEKILQESLSDESIDIGKTIYRNALGRISKSTKYYGDLRLIINESRTIGEFAVKLGNLIVYFDLDGFGDSIFRKRIQKEYYNAETLFSLSNFEKLPELTFNDETYSFVVNSYIDKKIQEFVYKFGEDIYIVKNKFSKDYKRKEFLGIDDEKIDHESLTSFCNSSKNVLVENLIMYKNSDNIDCYDLFDVVKSIENDNENKYSSAFVKHVKKVYDFDQILNPQTRKMEFPLLNQIIDELLIYDETLNKYTIEKNLGIYTNEELVINEREGEEEDQSVEEEGNGDDDEDEDDEDEKKMNELGGDELEEVKGGEYEYEEEDDEEEDDEEDEKNEDEFLQKLVGGVAEEDEDKDDEDEDDDDESEDDDDESEGDYDIDQEYEREKLRSTSKFNDYTGMSEYIYEDEKYSIGRNYVKGDGNCFFRSLYLAIIHDDKNNFNNLPDELRPKKLIIENKNFEDVDEFSSKARQYIADNYDQTLNNIVEFGGFMSDDEIYPDSQHALFGEAGKCYIKNRSVNGLQKNDLVDLFHNNEWVKGKVLRITEVDGGNSDEDSDDEEEVQRLYKIKIKETGEILRDVTSNKIMKNGKKDAYFNCAKKQIMKKGIYPTGPEIQMITELLEQSQFKIQNIIIPTFYRVKNHKSGKIEENVDIKDLLDSRQNVRETYDKGDSVYYRKSSLIKGKIIQENEADPEKPEGGVTYDIKRKKRVYKNIKINNIKTRSLTQKKSYEKNDLVLFRDEFKKGKIYGKSSDSTSVDKLSEKTKEKIHDEIMRYESSKDATKKQIYLLTDNTHYNFLTYEEDQLQMLDDGNFTNNLLKYLDTRNDSGCPCGEENSANDEDGNCSDDSENSDGGEESGEDDGERSDFSGVDEEEDGRRRREKNVCEKCHENIGKSFFKSKNFDKNCRKIKTVYFCSMECFKNFEKWREC